MLVFTWSKYFTLACSQFCFCFSNLILLNANWLKIPLCCCVFRCWLFWKWVFSDFFLPTNSGTLRNRILILEYSPKRGTYGLVSTAEATSLYSFSGKFIPMKQIWDWACRIRLNSFLKGTQDGWISRRAIIMSYAETSWVWADNGKISGQIKKAFFTGGCGTGEEGLD